MNDKEILESEARNFRSEIMNEVPNFDPNLILNSDQTGFNYETTTKRTLSFKGEKTTFLKVQSKSACTHSFTLQPTISYSGKCFKKLLICLKENNDVFGPIVGKEVNELLKTVKNVEVVWSRPGKITNNIINKWVNNLIENFDSIEDNVNILLLLDSLSSHWNQNFPITNANKNVKIHKKRIPKGTTSLDQPCDQFFNHELKYFTKKFT